MSSGLVKLIALTGAIGVGLLVVLQIQKGLTPPKFEISNEIEADLEQTSPKLTNLGDAPAATAAAVSPATAVASGDPAKVPNLLPDFPELAAPAAPAKIQLTSAALPPTNAPSSSTRADAAPGLSFKDDTSLEDPFGSDPSPGQEAAVAETPAERPQGPRSPAGPALGVAADAPAKESAAPASGLRLVAGDDADLSDPFAEEHPPARKAPPAGLAREIPDDNPLETESEPAAPLPGRATLSDDADSQDDPFGAAPPPLRRSPPEQVKPSPLPESNDDPFGALPAPKPLGAPRLAEPEPEAEAPTSPARNSEPDPFAEQEMPATSPRVPQPEPAELKSDDDPWPELGAPRAAPPTRRLEFDAEPDAEPTEPTTTAPDLPALRRSPAPALDMLLEDDPAPLQRGERAPRAIEIPGKSRELPLLESFDDEPAADRQEPLRLTGEREPAAADDFAGDGTAREGVPRGEQQPRLTIRKVAPPQATLGQPLIYEVLIKNVGDVSAHQVVVEDRIPRGTRLTGTIPRAEMLDKRLFWKLGTVEPGEERKISIRVIPEEEGPIGSVAKVNFVAEIAAEIVVTAPQLSLKVECPSQVRMGDAVQMKFVIRNSGNGDAKNVVLRDILPAGLQHPAGSDLENAIGDLKAGETRELTLELTANDAGTVDNQAVLTADGGLKVEDSTSIEIIGEQLKLTRKGQTKVYIGRASIYTCSVTNEGSQPVKDAQVVEDIPAGFDFVEASDGGRYDSQNRTVTWTLGEVGPGESREISAKYSARSMGDFTSRVQVTGASGSIASLQGQVSVAGMPALSIDSPGEGRVVAVGERLVSRILVQNRGTAHAENVELIVNLPAELKLVDAKGPSKFRREGRAVIFDPVPVVGARTKATYELTLQAVAEGDSRLELEIAADHLTKPVHREEVVQVVTGDVQPPR